MNSLSHNIRRFFFSTDCVICGKNDTQKYDYICLGCFQRLKEIKKPTWKGNYFYLYIYKDEIKEMITAFKLEGKKQISYILAELIRTELDEVIKVKKIDVIIPVPISENRLRERGFNQVEEILKNLKYNYLKIDRVKNTEHMYNLDDVEIRKKNVEAAFRNYKNLSGKRVLIFDDILTTGATVGEIIKEIERLGKPEQIYIFSLTAANSFSRQKIENRRR